MFTICTSHPFCSLTLEFHFLTSLELGSEDFFMQRNIFIICELFSFQQQQQKEPLYAQVRKPASNKREGTVIVDSGQGDAGTDSWV